MIQFKEISTVKRLEASELKLIQKILFYKHNLLFTLEKFNRLILLKIFRGHFSTKEKVQEIKRLKVI